MMTHEWKRGDRVWGTIDKAGARGVRLVCPTFDHSFWTPEELLSPLPIPGDLDLARKVLDAADAYEAATGKAFWVKWRALDEAVRAYRASLAPVDPLKAIEAVLNDTAHVPCGERARLILAALELSRKP